MPHPFLRAIFNGSTKCKWQTVRLWVPTDRRIHFILCKSINTSKYRFYYTSQFPKNFCVPASHLLNYYTLGKLAHLSHAMKNQRHCNHRIFLVLCVQFFLYVSYNLFEMYHLGVGRPKSLFLYENVFLLLS